MKHHQYLLVIFLILIISILACSSSGTLSPTATRLTIQSSTPTFLPTGTPTPLPTHTPTLIPTITFTATPLPSPTSPYPVEAACIPQNSIQQMGVVKKVIDGDTINVRLEDGKTYKVRYIGMDTPDQGDPFYLEAKTKNSELVAGKPVILLKDVSETDENDRLLRYVLVDDVFVNYEMVKSGYAKAESYPPDVACDDQFLAAQGYARDNMVGLWAPTPTQAITDTPGNCDPSYPTVCIPPPPPDLDCKDISYRRFKVLPPDPHHFDGDNNGIGCESG